MPRKTIPKSWRVADVTFVEIEITHRTDTQLRVEFDCGLRLVIADERQIPLAARGLESGALFAFTNKRRNRLKILYYDRTGACVLAKRHETGTFSRPVPSSAGAASLSLAPEALHLLLDGIDLRGAEMRPWYERQEKPPQSWIWKATYPSRWPAA